MLPIPAELIPNEQAELWRILQDRLRQLGGESVTEVVASSDTKLVRAGTHAQRMATPAGRAVGTFFYEQDRTMLYVAVPIPAFGMQWKVVGGKMRGTLNPNQKPTGLNNIGDVGFLFESTDFLHEYRWSGSAWVLTNANDRPGTFWLGNHDPGTGFKVCDGSTGVSSSTVGASVTTISVPNMVDAFLKSTLFYTGTQVAAVDGYLNGATDVAGAHDHGGKTGLATVAGTAGTGAATLSTNYHATIAATGNHSHNLTGVPVTPGEPDAFGVRTFIRL